MNKKGFTLIEIIAVIIITGVTVKDWHCSYSRDGSLPNGDAGYCWCEW